jgi:hypothetical protein
MRDLWASLAISVMWLAVLVVSLRGPDIRAFDVATIGSWAVAKHGFNRTANSR